MTENYIHYHTRQQNIVAYSYKEKNAIYQITENGLKSEWNFYLESLFIITLNKDLHTFIIAYYA